MTSTTLLPPPVAKEIRALALPWIACLACMVVPAISDNPLFFGGLAVPAYFVGAAALGALSMGHEYTGRTLSMLLSLPAQRSHLFAIKLAVLALMQLALWGVAYTLVFGDARLPQTARDTAALVPALCGLFVAPWLTMVCRSAIGGAVFAVAIPGTLLVMGEMIGTSVYGQGSVMEAFRLTFVWLGTFAICLVGAVMGWWAFMRLEVIEGPAEHVNFALLFARGTSERSGTQMTRRTPIMMLVEKELHLQQLAFAIAALFVVVSVVAISIMRGAENPEYRSLLGALTFLYAGLLSIVIGASASAGERQIGTLDSQVLQPISIAAQWSVKIAIVYGLSLTLALALPATFAHIGEFGDLWLVMRPSIFAGPVTVLLLLITGSLYVSSLSGSTLWALMMSMPVTMAAAMFYQFAWGRVGSATYRMVAPFAREVIPRGIGLGPVAPFRIMNAMNLLIVAGFIGLTLRFALENHRSADRAQGRLRIQVIALAAFVTLGLMCVSATTAFLVAMNRLR